MNDILNIIKLYESVSNLQNLDEVAKSIIPHTDIETFEGAAFIMMDGTVLLCDGKLRNGGFINLNNKDNIISDDHGEAALAILQTSGLDYNLKKLEQNASTLEHAVVKLTKETGLVRVRFGGIGNVFVIDIQSKISFQQKQKIRLLIDRIYDEYLEDPSTYFELYLKNKMYEFGDEEWSPKNVIMLINKFNQ